MKVHCSTPTAIGPDILRLCELVVPGVKPRYLAAIPADNAQPNDCFPNVEKHVLKHGGRQVIGWQLWEWPGVFAEAEFHAVWEKPDGTWLDITPKLHGETHTLFIPDPTRAYEGKWVANIKLPIAKGELIRDFIKLTDLGFEIVSNFNSVVTPAMEHYGLKLEEATITVRKMLEKGRTTRSKCICGGHLMYGDCHRHDVKDAIEAVTRIVAMIKNNNPMAAATETARNGA